MSPLVNKQSGKLLKAIVRDLPQALLLTGERGVGLSTLAKYIAQQQGVHPFIVLPVKNDKIDTEGTIPIEAIRDLYEQTRAKRGSKQIVIIDYADRLSIPAQNAFLKLLEEPNSSTYFILATHAPDQLLPTVRSRMTHCEIHPISISQSEAFLDQLGITTQTKRTQILFMAAGLPAEIKRLVDDESHFATRAARVRDARELLRGSAYEKLLVAHRYKDSRAEALQLIEDAAAIVRRTMSMDATQALNGQIERLLFAHSSIVANGNIRLCLTQLVIQ